MMLVFTALAQIAFLLLRQAVPAPQVTADEEILRGLVQQYYDAQTKKDADTAAGFWSNRR